MSTNSNLAMHASVDVRPLKIFAAVAVPVGWVLLTVPLLTGLPVEPFVLGVLFLGLVLPTWLLVRRDPHISGKALLRDSIRLPRPTWLLVPALVAIPGISWLVASVFGAQEDLTFASIASLALVNVASSVLIVNLWEELVWAGYVQRRAAGRFGFVGGALLTMLLFVGVHLPLAFYGADTASSFGDNLARLVVAGVGLRLLIGAFDLWSSRSILTVAILHASFNATSSVIDTDFDWVRIATTFALGALAALIVTRRSATINEGIIR